MKMKIRFTEEQMQGAILAALERGRRQDEEYRLRLIQLYGQVPAWAPKRIRRT